MCFQSEILWNHTGSCDIRKEFRMSKMFQAPHLYQAVSMKLHHMLSSSSAGMPLVSSKSWRRSRGALCLSTASSALTWAAQGNLSNVGVSTLRSSHLCSVGQSHWWKYLDLTPARSPTATMPNVSRVCLQMCVCICECVDVTMCECENVWVWAYQKGVDV